MEIKVGDRVLIPDLFFDGDQVTATVTDVDKRYNKAEIMVDTTTNEICHTVGLSAIEPLPADRLLDQEKTNMTKTLAGLVVKLAMRGYHVEFKILLPNLTLETVIVRELDWIPKETFESYHIFITNAINNHPKFVADARQNYMDTVKRLRELMGYNLTV